MADNKSEGGRHRDHPSHQSGDARKPVQKPKLTSKYEPKHTGKK